VVGIITQWSRISPVFAGLMQPKTPSATQSAGITPPATQSAGNIPPPTATAAALVSSSFLELRNKMTGNIPAHVVDDFSGATLGEYWANDGAQAGTLLDGALRLANEKLIGDGTITNLNYIRVIYV
jgi:hypothetical protein